MAAETHDLGTPYLRFERDGHLAWCTIDRPASRNALTATMYYGIKKAVGLVNAFEEPTALILTGTGDVFAPGGELRGQADDDNDHMGHLARGDVTPFEEVRHSFAPVVSAVFRAPELLRGIADTGYAAYLPAHIGVARARDLLLTGRRLDAEEARAMGLITRVVPHAKLRESAIEVAEDILRTAPEARMEVKRILHESYGHPDRMSMDWSLLHRDEAREGMTAFAEKRPPAWVPAPLAAGKRL